MEYNYTLSVALFHILMVAPILLYVGMKKNQTGSNGFFSLLSLSILLVGHHFMKFVSNYYNGKSYSLNLFHLLIIAPLLIYMSYYQENVTAYYYYIFLIGFGIMALYIHGKNLLTYLNVV